MNIVMLLSKKCPIHKAEAVGNIVKNIDIYRRLGLIGHVESMDLAKNFLNKVADANAESYSNRTYCSDCDMGEP
jgi:hypothetical protein